MRDEVTLFNMVSNICIARHSKNAKCSSVPSAWYCHVPDQFRDVTQYFDQLIDIFSDRTEIVNFVLVFLSLYPTVFSVIQVMQFPKKHFPDLSKFVGLTELFSSITLF